MSGTAEIKGINLFTNDFRYPFIHPERVCLLWQVFVKSSFVETKGGHVINEKVLSKRSDINKTPRNVVTEGTTPFGRSAASHRCRQMAFIRTDLAPASRQASHLWSRSRQ